MLDKREREREREWGRGSEEEDTSEYLVPRAEKHVRLWCPRPRTKDPLGLLKSKEKKKTTHIHRNNKRLCLWGGSKGDINFSDFFLCNTECSPCWALPEYIRALIHLACLRVFSVMPWVIVYRLYRVR